ncbi:alpha/beta-hydrolase [Mycena alexandri]|uniref:Carboxylic ester hydrolase n=1 Tax=Mycena alexandri TaxID=1745969 RepID=A0AAD6SSL9_9AGAR|nr:alpha/beta-hydrolase [Mycena alexandri]
MHASTHRMTRILLPRCPTKTGPSIHPPSPPRSKMFHLLPLALASLLTATSARTVDLDYAAYQSNLSLDPGSGVTSFLGVRYATAPTGPLRFRAPTAPTHVPGIQNATTPARQCWQAPGLVGSPGAAVLNRFRAGENSTIKSTSRIVESDYTMAVQGEWQQDKRDTDGISDEDCLFLNVHVPTVPKSKALLPVIVYLHGGGYDAGNISLYPTQNFVSLGSGGVIAVSVQYRLGVFGFLAGKEVKEEGDLNAGLLDQNFALQWVQKYISHFGGDPNKVTIWGQSAGAGAVLQHVVAHAGNTQPPLFRAAPANSPFLPFQYQYDDAIPECAIHSVRRGRCPVRVSVPAHYPEPSVSLVEILSCAHTSDTLQCLRAAPASALLAADTELGLAGFMGTYTFVPVVDGTFVVERPSVTLNQWGKVNGEALLVTTNSDEGAGFFVFPDALAANNFTLREYITQLFPRLPKASIGAAVELYSDANLGSSVADQATKAHAAIY